MNVIQIDKYNTDQNDLPYTLANIFKLSILNIDEKIYSHAQKQAWLGDYSIEFWQQRFLKTRPLVAKLNNQVIGFIEFLPEKFYIDCFYIHPKYQRQGVGELLLQAVLEMAKKTNCPYILVNASQVAKNSFYKHGFIVIQQNSHQRAGEVLVNWTMKYELSCIE